MTDFNLIAVGQITEADLAAGVDPAALTPAQILIGVKRYYLASTEVQAERLLKALLRKYLSVIDDSMIGPRLSFFLLRGAVVTRYKLGGATAVNADEIARFQAEATAQGITVTAYADAVYAKYKAFVAVESDLFARTEAVKALISNATTPEAAETTMASVLTYINAKLAAL